MTIAVATTDMTTLCDHLARSSAFVVLEIEDGRIKTRTVRERGTDACGNHVSFIDLASGCQAILCGGIGEAAAQSLAAHGITPVVAAQKHSIEEAANLYLSGQLATTTARICLCH